MQWDDLRLFRAIARSGSLRAAAAESDVSAATLSRRVTALERTLGIALFERLSNGYRLTEAGRETLAHVERMQGAALDIARIGVRDLPVVRIAAGAWTARFLAARLDLYLRAEPATPDDAFVVEWRSGSARLDLARREAEVGLRNERPEETSLAGRRIARIAFATYRKDGSPREIDGADWIVGADGTTPSARWIAQRVSNGNGRIVARVSEAALALPLLQADTGIAVLPCFAGDTEPSLERIGEPIAALAHEQWLVAHHDDRHLPAVRRVLDAIADIATREAALLAGERIG